MKLPLVFLLGAGNSWATSMFLPGDRRLKRNTLIGTIPTLTKEWKVTFEFKPTSYNYNGYAQILHLTTGGKGGSIVGERIPALWIHKKSEVVKVLFKTALNGKPNEGLFSAMKPPINKWSTVEVIQEREGSVFFVSLIIRGETIWSERNRKPQEFSNVKVYASSDWYVAQAGYIRGFKIQNKIPGRILILLTKWSLSQNFFCSIAL